MSAAPGSDVLRDLLHSVCQPLTTLHCALESSLSPEQSGHVADVALALEQTDRVIETVRLMREYLEVEQGCSSVALVPVGSAVDVVLNQVSVLAEARSIRLFACGASQALIPVHSVWLQRALLYLVGALVETESPDGAVAVLLEDGESISLLSGHSLPGSSSSEGPAPPLAAIDPLQAMKFAIAQRTLESSGASVEFYASGRPGFAIRIPRAGSGRGECSV